MNENKTIVRDIIDKLLKTKDNMKNLKSAEGKQTPYIKGKDDNDKLLLIRNSGTLEENGART